MRLAADRGACFDISRNYRFGYPITDSFHDAHWSDEPVLLSELPDLYHVYVICDAAGQLSVAIDKSREITGAARPVDAQVPSFPPWRQFRARSRP